VAKIRPRNPLQAALLDAQVLAQLKLEEIEPALRQHRGAVIEILNDLMASTGEIALNYLGNR
jgi:hypothetical protein